MCGISGDIRFDGTEASVVAVAAMNDAQTPRGPDTAGLYAHQQVALGHRRLSIIDLSQKGAQPMIDSRLGLCCVFNGCIYNYPELRRELMDKGYTFFSTSDTEVLLKGYAHWGEDFVTRLNGMFAFALYERNTGALLLGRDRLGIKPLYLAATNGGLRFASTLPALLKAGGVDTAIDPVALQHYMTFHGVVPAPRTLLKGVRKLPPATLLRVEKDGTLRERNYWRVQYGARDDEKNLSAKDWEDRVLDVFRQSVKRRLVADVPVGVLLSGGLDSSLVVGLLADQGQQGLETFSIGFEAAGGEQGDEFQYSDLVAKHYGTKHHKIFIRTEEMLPNLAPCVAAMAEPMTSHDNVGFYLLSREVAKHLKVVQSGQGADEIFAGYHWYPPMMTATADTAVQTYADAFFDRHFDEYSDIVNAGLVTEDHASTFVREHFAAPGTTVPIDQALRLDSTVMLVEDPVKRVDNMTMAWGLEARVPFLDHEVVELAARVPGEHKVAQGGKGVLKEAARRVIPHGVIDRPKGYFPVPVLKYIGGPTLDLVKDILSQPAATKRGLFKKEYVDRLLSEPDQHITPLRGNKLWQIAILEYWLQTHGVDTGPA